MPELAEFFPKDPNLLGININHGQRICVRLRPARNEAAFLPYEHILGTLLHELTHIVHGPHQAPFYKLLDEITGLVCPFFFLKTKMNDDDDDDDDDDDETEEEKEEGKEEETENKYMNPHWLFLFLFWIVCVRMSKREATKRRKRKEDKRRRKRERRKYSTRSNNNKRTRCHENNPIKYTLRQNHVPSCISTFFVAQPSARRSWRAA